MRAGERGREHHADPACQLRSARMERLDTSDDHAALDRRADHPWHEPGGREDQRRFAGIGTPGDSDHGPRVHPERHVGERLGRSPDIADVEVLDSQGWSGPVHRPTPTSAASKVAAMASRASQRSPRSPGGSATMRYAVRCVPAPKARASSAKVRSRTSMSDPSRMGATSGTRAPSASAASRSWPVPAPAVRPGSTSPGNASGARAGRPTASRTRCGG